MYLIVSYPCVLYSFRGLHSNYNNKIILKLKWHYTINHKFRSDSYAISQKEAVKTLSSLKWIDGNPLPLHIIA